MRKHSFLTKRQKKRASLRRLYGNPWDSTSSSSRTKTSSKKMSSAKTKTAKKSVTFRQPLERSASKSKSSSNVWRTVSSKSISK